MMSFEKVRKCVSLHALEEAAAKIVLRKSNRVCRSN
jgi:hypothetical protein